MYLKTSDQPELNLGFRDYKCNWGVHICGLYETEEERDEIILGYLSEGLKSDDLQLYVAAERTKDDFIQNMSDFCPNCSKYLNNPDKIRILDAKSLYYPNGLFSPKAMDDGLGAFYKESQNKGKRNVRATAEMLWALEAIPGVEYLMVYESKLNYFIPGKPWISICMYNITKFDGQIIMNALQTHPYTISNGVLLENPYYIKPDKWLKDNAPQFINK